MDTILQIKLVKDAYQIVHLVKINIIIAYHAALIIIYKKGMGKLSVLLIVIKVTTFIIRIITVFKNVQRDMQAPP